MIAQEIMQKKVVTASPSMTLKELAVLLVDHQITGAPVVNSVGLLVGVVSQTDLVRHEREEAGRTKPTPGYYREEFYKPGLMPRVQEETRVRDCMTPIVISANRDDDVQDVARMMLDQHVHRMIIAENGRLFGIVTTMDLIKAWVKPNGNAKSPKRHAKARTGRKQ